MSIQDSDEPVLIGFHVSVPLRTTSVQDSVPPLEVADQDSLSPVDNKPHVTTLLHTIFNCTPDGITFAVAFTTTVPLSNEAETPIKAT